MSRIVRRPTGLQSSASGSSMCEHRRLRSGIGTLGSIPMVTLVVVVFAVFALLRYACLRIELQGSSESVAKREIEKEAPMKVRTVLRSVGETAENLGENVAVGLFLS